MISNDKVKILVVDDEIAITEFIKMGLMAEGYHVLVANDGVQALKMAAEHLPHIVILDLMLPGVSGFDVCEILKKTIDTSIIMLTAREDIDDRVKGLMIGADDYMVKPFSFKELLARIHVRIRNSELDTLSSRTLGGFRIDPRSHEIHYANKLLELSLTEYNLLEFLLQNSGNVMSKSTILEKVWGYDFVGDDNIVEVYVRAIRKKLGDSSHQIISTIRGVGYKINVHFDRDNK